MKKTLLTLSSIFVVGSLSAAWKTIDDLESHAADAAPPAPWTIILQDAANYQTLPSTTVVADPLGAGQGNVLAINPGVAATTSSANQTIEFALPEGMRVEESLTPGALSTFYFKIGRPLVEGVPGEVDITYGLVAESARDSVAGTHGYGSYSVLGRYEKDGIMDIRDEATEDNYVNLTTAALNTDTYYEVWFVIDHFSFTYDQYIKGGTDFPDQTKIYTGALYRNQAIDALETMLFFTSAGTIDAVKGKHDIYFDDFSIDPDGENLTSPDGGGAAAGTAGKLINISTRGTVGTGDNVLIGSLIIGEDSQQVLIQAVGQELAGVEGTLADPVLELRNPADNSVIAMNDNWEDTQKQEISDVWGGSPPLAEGSTSAAILITLDQGSYSGVVIGKDGSTGVGLIEIYEID